MVNFGIEEVDLLKLLTKIFISDGVFLKYLENFGYKIEKIIYFLQTGRGIKL